MRALRMLAPLLVAACALDEAGTASPLPDGALGATGGSGGAQASGGSGGIGGSAAAAGDAGSSASGAGGSGGFQTALHLARIEVPCITVVGVGCNAAKSTSELTFEGVLGKLHDVTLRIRGVVELTSYQGGTPDNTFRTGGQGIGDNWAQFAIRVSNPPQTYYLNNGVSGTLHCHALDYSRTIPIAGGAIVTLVGDPLDGQQVKNVDASQNPIVVPGVPPAPQPFDGQFIQIDVLTVAAR